MKLISNTTVEISRDKLLGLYSNIQPFYTKYKKFTTSLNGMSRILNLSVLHPQIPKYPGISQRFPCFFFNGCSNPKREPLGIRDSRPLGSEKGSGSRLFGIKRRHQITQESTHVPSDQGVHRPPISIVKPLRQPWGLTFGHHIASTVLCYPLPYPATPHPSALGGLNVSLFAVQWTVSRGIAF